MTNANSNNVSLKEYTDAQITDLQRAMEVGDERLREHIQKQAIQIEAALVSANALEVERVNRVHREAELVAEASKEAISKAEASNERRFKASNEFRQSLIDQAATFLPRKEYDARHDTLVTQVQTLNDRLNRGEGKDVGSAERDDRLQTWKIALLGMGITIFLTVVVIVVNLATVH